MSLQDRKTAEPAGSATPLYMGFAAAAVLLATSLLGSNLPPAPVVSAAATTAATTVAKAADANTTKAATAVAAAPAAAVATAGKAADAAATVATKAADTATAAATTAATTVVTKTADATAKTDAPAAAVATAATTAATTAAGTVAADATKVAQAAATATPATATTAAPKPDVPLDQLLAPGPLPEMVLGDAKAPVTIVEYASMTCPHCADFHKRVYEALKTKYIDTGKARLIFREFPLDNMAAAVSQLARCLGPMRYFAFVGTMFDRQEEWHTGDNDLPKLQSIAKEAGFTDASFKACVTDAKQLANITETRKIADEKFNVHSTPTFFVNGVQLKEGHELTDFDAVISQFVK